MSIHNCEDGSKVDILNDLIPYIKYKGYEPVQVLTHYLIPADGLNIDENSPRYKAANTKYPLIAIEKDDWFKLVDGRHRLKKLMNERQMTCSVYFITEDELDLFKRVL
tara:strand:- start:10373 stop:10696 length:324 start_codon:yes stop_codon:yes gene_type:complete